MAPFRFLDLAAELRNNVYEQALTHDRAHGIIAAAGLLRTCRQVYSESKEILYAQSTFTITATSISPPNIAVVLGGDMTRTSIRDLPTIGIFRALPRRLLELTRLHVQLDFEPDERGIVWNTRTMNMSLFALVDLLNADGRPRRLEISIKQDLPNHLADGARYMLDPLHRLQTPVEIDLPKHLAASIGMTDNMMVRHRQSSIPWSPISDFVLLATFNQSVGWPQDTAVHRYGYDLFKKAEKALSDHEHGWLGPSGPYLAARTIAARGLLSMSTEEELDQITEPPEWLITCLKMMQSAMPRRGRGKQDLKMLLKPLAHLIDAIVEEE